MAKEELPEIRPPEVRKARKAQLQAWCEERGLDPEGTVPVLRERLLEFLESEEYLVLEEEEEEAPSLPPRKAGQVYLYGVSGKVRKVLDLPAAFRGEVRPDVIQRAVTAARANRRQPYGPSAVAGLQHAVEWAGKGRGLSRVPRIDGRRGAQAPGTVGGRRSHPPRPERRWGKKMNAKERRLARRSALVASADPELVVARGHRVGPHLSLPVVVEAKAEQLAATKEAVGLLEGLGLADELARVAGKKVRAGRGTMRGRRYRRRTGPLVVLPADAPARRAFANVPGVHVVTPEGLTTEALAPGGVAGRLTLFSENALRELEAAP